MRVSATLCAALLQAAALVQSSPVAAPKPALEAPKRAGTKHLRPVLERRAGAQFDQGQPISADGKGGPFSGGTNKALDLQNPDNLGRQSTDNGLVVNLKWAFSDSKTRLLNGGWVREQTITDLPSSKDIAAAQQHIAKGVYRELHWHRTAEWGYLYSGEVLLTATDSDGRNTVDHLVPGDIWYFPKGSAHGLQGLADNNEYLLVFDDGNFDATGTTFMVTDWIAHTPRDILAKNFGVNASVFDSVPKTDPYIFPGNISDTSKTASPYGKLEGNSSYVFHATQQKPITAPGGGGTISIIDSRNFPVAKTLAAAVGVLKPGALRELHWHPNAEEWLYIAHGTARATAFLGGANARTFDFSAGDTAVFPDNAGHYIENTGNDTLTYLELYKSDRVEDISLTQWLALTPAQTVAETLKVDISVVNALKKEKQLIVAA